MSNVRRRRGITVTLQPKLPIEFKKITTTVGPIDIVNIGISTGRPIIFTSHGLGSRESLLEVAIGLADCRPNHRVICWSRPGRGATPEMSVPVTSETLHHEALVVVPAMMSALGLRTADFFGHGDGATLPLILAFTFPEMVGRIAALAPYVCTDSNFESALNGLPDDETSSGLYSALQAVHAAPQDTYERWKAQRLKECKRGWSVLDNLTEVHAPLLLIQGAKDDFISLSQLAAIAKKVTGPVEWTVLQGHGHIPQKNSPTLVTLLLNHFFSPKTAASSPLVTVDPAWPVKEPLAVLGRPSETTACSPA